MTTPTTKPDYVLVPRELIDRFPEINMANYNDDDVGALNAWGIEIVAAAPPAAPSLALTGEEVEALNRAQESLEHEIMPAVLRSDGAHGHGWISDMASARLAASLWATQYGPRLIKTLRRLSQPGAAGAGGNWQDFSTWWNKASPALTIKAMNSKQAAEAAWNAALRRSSINHDDALQALRKLRHIAEQANDLPSLALANEGIGALKYATPQPAGGAVVDEAMVERDDLIYTDEMFGQAANDVGLFKIIDDGVPWTQSIARLRGFFSRVTALASRERKSDRATLTGEQAAGGGND
jgi:hypothetical protein